MILGEIELINFISKATKVLISSAFEDALAHSPDERTGTQKLRYSLEDTDVVELEFTPTEEMEWGIWVAGLLGIGGFFDRWEYVTLKFDVLAPGLGRLGTGRVFQQERTGLNV